MLPRTLLEPNIPTAETDQRLPRRTPNIDVGVMARSIDGEAVWILIHLFHGLNESAFKGSIRHIELRPSGASVALVLVLHEHVGEVGKSFRSRKRGLGAAISRAGGLGETGGGFEERGHGPFGVGGG